MFERTLTGDEFLKDLKPVKAPRKTDFHSLTEHLKNLQILNITLFISWHLTREIT